jgi:hypothetical protein
MWVSRLKQTLAQRSRMSPRAQPHYESSGKVIATPYHPRPAAATLKPCPNVKTDGRVEKMNVQRQRGKPAARSVYKRVEQRRADPLSALVLNNSDR